MSLFTVPTSLTGPPRLQYGFWYSYGSTQARGHMLTLTNFWASYLSLALSLLVGWAVSRLWRIGCTVFFYFSYTEHPSWEESQNNVLIVNSTDAIAGFMDSYTILRSRNKAYRRESQVQYNTSLGNHSPKYRRAKYIILSVMAGGFLIVGLKAAIPFIIALIPLTKLGLVVPTSCNIFAVPSDVYDRHMAPAEFFVQNSRWANAAFAMLDKSLPNRPMALDTTPSNTEEIAFPEHVKSFTNTCPPGVTACSTEHPFTFSSNYTLFSYHLGLNVQEPFSLSVFETCYRPISTLSPFKSGNDTRYGLYYGPIVSPFLGRGQATVTFSSHQVESGSYSIFRIHAKAGVALSYSWTPNTTLVQGGDTTLLVYRIGGVLMREQSLDPIFATQGLPDPSLGDYFTSQSVVVPIICDTKYMFCDGNGGSKNCSSPGGARTIDRWLEGRGTSPWNEIQFLLVGALSGPPISVAAFGSASVLAAQSTYHAVQYAPKNITTFKELSRLSMAGMAMLSSYAQTTVNGFWNQTGRDSSVKIGVDLDSLCNQVIMELPTVTTIPVVPYMLFLTFSLIIVAISYSSSFHPPQRILTSSFRRVFRIWKLYRPGLLHKRLAEGIRGRDFEFSTTGPWPTAPYQSGPSIITQRDVECFGSGSIGVLENAPEDMDEKEVKAFKNQTSWL